MTSPAGRNADPTQADDDPVPSGRCPFLASDSGAWVASSPSGAHRCGAVAPPASLSVDKQRRLCLVGAHTGCATFLAASTARAERIPAREREAAGWGWVRTTPIVDARLGIGPSLVALVGDRRRWQVLPAVVLVVALVALGVSNLNGGSPSPTARASSPGVASPSTTPPSAVPSSTVPPTATPSPTPSAIPSPTPAPSASAAPSPNPTSTPSPSARTTYTVKSGDSLYLISVKYGVSVAAIKALNGLTSNTLHTGQKLLIP